MNWLYELTQGIGWTMAGDLLTEALSGISSQAAAAAVNGAGFSSSMRNSNPEQAEGTGVSTFHPGA